jgi:Permuted papain-like amidase enzyme, YaeF/YiiX, C92 family
MTLLRINLFITAIILLASCTNAKKSKYQAGDILMQQIECGPLCDAINKVTDGYQGKDYNHCALVVAIGDSLVVIEAIGSGANYNSLKDFYARVGDDTAKTKATLHLRLKSEYKNLIPKAVATAKGFIGQSYDDAFILDNNKMYCSEVIHDAFKAANNGSAFFNCQPMTFKDPQTKEFFPPWVEYYKDLKVAIPEGILGINPGLISRSNLLEVVNE